MPRTKRSACKQVTGGPSCPSCPGGSDDSQEKGHPWKRPAHPHSPASDSSTEESDYEDELEHMEQAEYVAVRTTSPKPGTRRPTFKPPPPPVQPQGDARRISLEPPLTLGRKIKRFNEVPILSFVVMLTNFRLLATLRTIVFALTSRQTFLPLSSFLRVSLCMCALI